MDSPPKRRVFWGWWVFAGAILSQFVTIGVSAQSWGAFLEPMTTELGWSRSQFAIAPALGFAAGGVLGFFLGPLIDRYGARPFMFVGVLVAAAALVAVSRVTELWQFILFGGLIAQLGFFMTGPFVTNTTLSKWFVIRRGQVIALASIGVSLGSIIPPIAVTRIVDRWGWETGWIVLAGVSVALIVPAAAVMRREPEDFGLMPDGKTGAEESTDSERKMMEMIRLDFVNSYTRAEAVRTPALWLLAVGFGLAMAGMVAIFSHAIPFFTDSGFTRGEAAGLFAVQGSTALVSKFFWAQVTQRWSTRRLTTISMGIMAVGTAALVPAAGSGSLLLTGAALAGWGVGVGGMMPIMEFVWASFFGRRYIGGVRTASLPISILLGGAGPIYAGAYFDRTGSYDGAFLSFALLWGLAVLLISLAPKPPPKEQDAEQDNRAGKAVLSAVSGD